MNQHNYFELEIASRLALHEALLENLYSNLLRKMPDAQQRWQGFENLLLQAMGDLQAPGELQSDDQKQWLLQQRATAQMLARQFTERVATQQGWGEKTSQP